MKYLQEDRARGLERNIPESLLAEGRLRQLVLLLAGVLLAIAALYMARTLIFYGRPNDYAYFWAAGQIWMAGGNPYDPSFSAVSDGLAAGNPEMADVASFHRLLYTPHVWGLATALSAFGFETGRLVWGGLSALLFGAGSWLIVATRLDPQTRLFPLLFALATAVAAVTFGTVMALAAGQFTAFAYFAMAAFVYGVLHKHDGAVVLALVILTMKPSIALPFVAVALAAPRLWRPLLLAGGISILLAVPALLASGPFGFLEGYLDGLASYQGYPPNAAVEMTGLRNLAWYLADVDVSGMWLSIAAAALCIAIARLDAAAGTVLSAPALFAILATSLFLVPLHTYELTLVLVLGAAASRWPLLLSVIAGAVVLFRVHRLSAHLGVDEAATRFEGSLLSSWVLLGLFVVALAVFAGHLWKERNP